LSGWPVWLTSMPWIRSRIRRISRAAMSMSLACPPSPDIHGWWMRIREFGSE